MNASGGEGVTELPNATLGVGVAEGVKPVAVSAGGSLPVAMSIESLTGGLSAHRLAGVLDTCFVAFAVIGCCAGNTFAFGRAKWGGRVTTVGIFYTGAISAGL